MLTLGYDAWYGIENKSVTSMKNELGFELDFIKVSEILKEKLAQVFEFKYDK